MSEPTPLSAEELAWACDNFSPHAMEGMAFRELREARAKIAALRGALEDLMDEQNGPPLIRDAASWQAAMDNALRVLAGKEAQCPKCEGRGFIRTMVDGERDSEPCSFCRMSGLAGKEAQG